MGGREGGRERSWKEKGITLGSPAGGVALGACDLLGQRLLDLEHYRALHPWAPSEERVGLEEGGVEGDYQPRQGRAFNQGIRKT